MPPSSCTLNVKLAYAAPFALSAGANLSLPAAISLALTIWPAVTAVPLRLSVPASGSVDTMTLASALLSPVASVKPKSVAASVYGVSSFRVSVAFAPAGASLTGVMLIASVYALALIAEPSETLNVSDVAAVAFAAGR